MYEDYSSNVLRIADGDTRSLPLGVAMVDQILRSALEKKTIYVSD